jgi:hypothetical protein
VLRSVGGKEAVVNLLQVMGGIRSHCERLFPPGVLLLP